MFTGIVEELGRVVSIDTFADSAWLTVAGPKVSGAARPGDSIAVNGVCLTVAQLADGTFTADVMRETLQRSNLGSLVPGACVSLERPVALSDRLGGHLVQGHVDGTGRILARTRSEHWDLVTISLPEQQLARYVVEKGSIAVDGASLTVTEVTTGSFTVSLIPTTLDLTTVGRAEVGDAVNIEVDIVAKYVEKLVGGPR